LSEENILLGSQSPDADVLFYNKDKAYYQGNLQLRDSGVNYDLEFDNNGTIVTATYEYVR
jgi:hypothetical protein